MSKSWRFSNFIPVLIESQDDGLLYPSIEHFYQAHKTLDFEKRKEVLKLQVAQSKRWGRSFEARPDWEEVKESVMLEGLRQRYNKEPFKSELLAATPSDLVEWTYWHDVYWGKCTCKKCDGRGQNRLGVLLGQVQKELRGS